MRSMKSFSLYVLLVLCLGFLSCSGSLFRNYGRILPSGEATRDLESGVFRPEFRYYISGSDLYPNALIGLHRDYRLDPETLWKEVQMTPEKMKEIVEHMNTKASYYLEFQKGFELLDNNGRPIGVWYSLPKARTSLRIQEDGTVRIDTPDLDTYDKKAGSLMMDNER